MLLAQIILDDLTQEIEEVTTSPFFTLHPFFVILFWVMLLYVVFVMLVPLVSSLINVVRHWRKGYNESLQNKYKIILFDYMASGFISDEVFKDLEKTGNKRILADQIYELTLYIEGDEALRLRTLFNDLKLYKYIVYRVSSPFCYKRAYYLKRLSLSFQNEQAMRIAKRYVNDRNMEVRLAAIQTIIRMDPNRMESLFLNYHHKLSLWEQMCYYDFFAHGGLPIPDFHSLVFAKNDTVVLFAIRMIRMFRQQLGTIKGYEFLLNYPSMDVQGEMFRTLAEFGYTDIGQLLNNFLPSMPLLVRMHIMTFLSKRPETTTDIMMQYYQDSDSPEFRLHILYCIYNFVKNGKEDIEQFVVQQEDQTLRGLSAHLITNVL